MVDDEEVADFEDYNSGIEMANDYQIRGSLPDSQVLYEAKDADYIVDEHLGQSSNDITPKHNVDLI